MKTLQQLIEEVQNTREIINYEGAVLDGICWREKDLICYNLRKAHLENAILQDAIMCGTDLEEANLKRANLQGTHLEHANFKNANLEGADFRYARFRQTNFKGANLKNAKFDFEISKETKFFEED